MKHVHKKQLVDLPFDGKQEIDIELIPLVTELNKVGLITVECCQGGKGTLADEPEKECPAYITLELGKNIGCSIKPLGGDNQQRLVIYWKKKGGNVLF